MDDFVAKFGLFGVSALVIVMGGVQLTKWVAPNIPDRLLPWVVLAWSGVVAGLVAVVNLFPQFTNAVQYIMLALGLALMAMGTYSGGKSVAGK